MTLEELKILIKEEFFLPLEEFSVREIFKNSILIPKPKFKVGDYVREIDNPDMNALCICSVFFDPAKMAWYYILSDNLAYDEHELKLVEEQK